jgi:hypothetical protein
LVILCDTGSHLKEKINKRGGVGRANSSSKAFGISFADRPKANRKTNRNDWSTAFGNFKTSISSLYPYKNGACYFSLPK